MNTQAIIYFPVVEREKFSLPNIRYSTGFELIWCLKIGKKMSLSFRRQLLKATPFWCTAFLK